MSEVAGRMSVQAGAHHLEKAQGGLGSLLGGVPGVLPARVLIIDFFWYTYQHIPIRALYQLQLMVEHIKTNPVHIDAEVFLYQSNQDPVVDPVSVEKLNQIITARDKSVVTIEADRHGVVYENLDDIQQKICATIQ